MQRIKYAVFTMDVETFSDTECIKNLNLSFEDDMLDGFDEYLELLDKYDIKSTLFTVGNLAPKMYDRLSRAIKNGHRLALHSWEHNVTHEQNLERFKQKMRDTKQNLDTLFNTNIQGFRAPFFSIDNDHLDALRAIGFKYDSSHLGFTPARHNVGVDLKDYKRHRDGISSKKGFFEFSLSLSNIFGKPYPISGGGYLRLAQWDFIKAVLRDYIQNHDFYVFYLHPFELSKKKIPIIKGLKSYDQYYLKAGLQSYKKHIEQIILLLKKSGYQFVTFEELTELMSRP